MKSLPPRPDAQVFRRTPIGNCLSWLAVGFYAFGFQVEAASFDAAPFGLPLPEGHGVMWEDPREIHRVIVHFNTAPTEPAKVPLEYWGSRWLRYLFVREEGDELLLGQAVPREWLKPGQRCGLDHTATYFGPASVLYTGGENEITAQVEGPRRNQPKTIRLRFREPAGRPLHAVTVNGKPWKDFSGEWVRLPDSALRANRSAIEKHHLFPRNHLSNLGTAFTASSDDDSQTSTTHTTP